MPFSPPDRPIYWVPIRKTSQITDGTHLEQPSIRKIGQITDGEPVLSVASILAMICIKMVRVQRYEKGFQGNGPNTQASCSKHDARATPKGSRSTLCAGDTENAKQPTFYVEPTIVRIEILRFGTI